MKKNVLIFVQIPTHFVEMFRVAQLLQSQSSYRPIVLFMAMYHGVEKHIDACAAADIAYLTEPGLGRYRARAVEMSEKRRWTQSLSALRTGVQWMGDKARLGTNALVNIALYLTTTVMRTLAAARTALFKIGAHLGWLAQRFAQSGRHLIRRGFKGLAVILMRPLIVTTQLLHAFDGLTAKLRRIFSSLPQPIAAALRAIWRVSRSLARPVLRLLRSQRLLLQGARVVLIRSPLYGCVCVRALLHEVFWRPPVCSLVGFALRVRQKVMLLCHVAETQVQVFLKLGARLLSRVERRALKGWALCIAQLKAWVLTSLQYLIRPFPGANLQRRLDALPRPIINLLSAFWYVLGGAAWLVIWLFRPLLRVGAVSVFGVFYRYAPDLLPPECRVLRQLWRAVPKLIDDENIEVLILPEDNFYYFTNFFVKAMHARGGVVLIVPFTIVNVLEWAEAFFDQTSHSTRVPVNRLIALLFPQWVLQHRGRKLVMPAHHVLCNEYFKVSPPIPWLINSGHVDKIAAESRFMENYYLSSGIPARQIQFTGALYDDVLFHARRAVHSRRSALYGRLGCSPKQRLILCALPPNQLRGQGRPQCSFDEYALLLKSFVEPLSHLVDTCNVLLTPHPRIDEEDLVYVKARGLYIARDNIADLVPLCDLYIASCSATIRLAVNCGIPVVNYDVYRYDYDDYKNVPGIKTISQNEDYVNTVHQLGDFGTEYAVLESAQQVFAAQETLMDGQAGCRIVSLIDELLCTAKATGVAQRRASANALVRHVPS